jgi:hypothetical protein
METPKKPEVAQAPQPTGCECSFCAAEAHDGEMGADYMAAEHAEWYHDTFEDLK